MKGVKQAENAFIDDGLRKSLHDCGHCGSVDPKWRCSRCRCVKYCNKQCQRNAWKIKHGNQCHLIYREIHGREFDAHREETNFSNVCEVYDKIFSNNSTYPILETDTNMHVMVTDLVSFGDLEDARRTTIEKIPVGGTIIGTIHTVRHFHPGVYRCTRVIPFENWLPVFIYHHENIDPAKIMRQSFLMMRDFTTFYRDIRNSINRYDWTHWSYLAGQPIKDDEDDDDDKSDDDESDDEGNDNEKLINKIRGDMFFTRAEDASCLKRSVKNYNIVYSNIIPSLYTVTSPQLNSPIAMAVKIESEAEPWKKGKAFQDISSQRYFALMIYSYFGMIDLDDDIQGVRDVNTKLTRRYPDKQFTSVKETEFKFNMTDFSV